jgi:hypothetical protein
MERRRDFLSPFPILRIGFTFALLLVSGFEWASAAHAQDDLATVTPVSAAEPLAEGGLRAYVGSLPSSPTPKVEPVPGTIVQQQSQIKIPTEHTHSFYWLDRKSLMYGLMQGGAEVFDGITTRYFIHHCSHCYESDPISRLLMGAHPSWGKMIPMGIAEAAVSTYSYQRLSRSPNRILRTAAPLVPVGLTAVHVIEGARNITLKNRYRCADPGYVVVGAVCVPAPSVLSGASNTRDGGSGSRRNPF